LTHFLETVHGVITNIDPYLGILAFVPILLTFSEVWFGRRRRHQKWLQEIIKNPGGRPAILVVDILPGREIAASVEVFRQQSDALKAIPQERIFKIDAVSIAVASTELAPTDMMQFSHRTRVVASEIYKAGVDVIHYFHSGPLPTVAIVGAALANGPRVMMYHWRQGSYESWGPIKHPGDFG
jgi:hypothetical protein